MSNRKRVTIRCWNCAQTYTLPREFDRQATLSVGCPFCHQLGIVPLAPFVTTTVEVKAGDDAPGAYTLDKLTLPDILPSEPVPTDHEG